jgi:hypothetical protein
LGPLPMGRNRLGPLPMGRLWPAWDGEKPRGLLLAGGRRLGESHPSLRLSFSPPFSPPCKRHSISFRPLRSFLWEYPPCWRRSSRCINASALSLGQAQALRRRFPRRETGELSPEIRARDVDCAPPPECARRTHGSERRRGRRRAPPRRAGGISRASRPGAQPSLLSSAQQQIQRQGWLRLRAAQDDAAPRPRPRTRAHNHRGGSDRIVASLPTPPALGGLLMTGR